MTNMTRTNKTTRTTRTTRKTATRPNGKTQTRKTATEFKVGDLVMMTSNLGGCKMATVEEIRPRLGFIRVTMNADKTSRRFKLNGRTFGPGSHRIERYDEARATELDAKFRATKAAAVKALTSPPEAQIDAFSPARDVPQWAGDLAAELEAKYGKDELDRALDKIDADLGRLKASGAAKVAAGEPVVKTFDRADVDPAVIAGDWLEAFKVADEIAEAAGFDWHSDEQKAAVAAVIHARFLGRFAPSNK